MDHFFPIPSDPSVGVVIFLFGCPGGGAGVPKLTGFGFDYCATGICGEMMDRVAHQVFPLLISEEIIETVGTPESLIVGKLALGWLLHSVGCEIHFVLM